MRFIQAYFVILLLAISTVLADFDSLTKGVYEIGQNLNFLRKAVNAKPMDYVAALNIDSKARQLTKKINDVESIVDEFQANFTISETQTLIKNLYLVERKVNYTVIDLIHLKPQLENLGVMGVARSDVHDIAIETEKLISSLLHLVPPQMISQGRRLARRVNHSLIAVSKAFGVSYKSKK